MIMKQKVVTRYSICFKRQVIADIEGGRFESITQAQHHYGIVGNSTIKRWLQKYGKNHLMAKVIRVQKPNEKDQIRQLKQQVAELQRALGQTQVKNVLNEEFLKIACEELGCDVETIKKKADTAQSPKPGNGPA
jgi:transposase-like protein|tara:strand:+ start:52 stop:453 length:402 start_codon:yes stop_codon:yes gene_type:complete